MTIIMSLIVCVLLSQNLRAVNNETLKIYDILSSVEYNSSYPFTYKGINNAGDTVDVVISNGQEFLKKPANTRFWIRDYTTGIYWDSADVDFDLELGLYLAGNRSFSEGRQYILIIFKGELSIFKWPDLQAVVMINEVLTKLNYSSCDKMKIIDNILNDYPKRNMPTTIITQKVIK